MAEQIKALHAQSGPAGRKVKSAMRPCHIPSGLYPGSGRRLPLIEGDKTVSTRPTGTARTQGGDKAPQGVPTGRCLFSHR